MKIDWDVLEKRLRFFVGLFTTPLAKKLSIMFLAGGIGLLSSPIWVDLVNWFLKKQNYLPQFSEPILENKDIYAWILISLSILVYLIEKYFQHKANKIDPVIEKKLLDTIKEHRNQTANLIIDQIRDIGFTAQHLQDERITEITDKISLLRFFKSLPTKKQICELAERIISGDLSGGTSKTKARSLALLARYLCMGEKTEQAKKWLLTSKELCRTDEAEIAQVCIDAIGSKNINLALDLLKIKSPLSYSAFFMIKNTVEGSTTALSWFESTGLSIDNFDNDGKIVLISILLSEYQWEKALNIVGTIDNESLSISPALAQLSAFTFLTNAIKATELRENVMNYVPLAAKNFPLADDSRSIDLRNRSVEIFKVFSRSARQLGAEYEANVADIYVLWLELRNNETHDQAKAQLQSYFHTYTQKSLQYLPLAFAFRIEIDYESVEKEVNKQTALSNDNNPTLGLARFILAHTKKPFTVMLQYISDHRKQIEKDVSIHAIKMLEIEALAQSGLVDDAEQLLKKIDNSIVSATEIRVLKSIIESAKGKDPIAMAISQYQQSKSIHDLSHLVNLLESEDIGEKCYSYSKELFDRTSQKYDAIRVCNAASSLEKFTELHQFLTDQMDLVKISEELQTHWAWSLFRMGKLSEAHEQVKLLRQAQFQHPSLQNLEINLSIFSGDWESLSNFVEDSWNNREHLGSNVLLQAAQLAKAVSPKRVKNILEYCTYKFPKDPQVFASSYVTATAMGWEDNPVASEWLSNAISLSGEEGPLHTISLEDLIEMMRDSKKKNKSINNIYSEGSAPIFAVAKLLNSHISNFYLIQPFENKRTIDIREKKLVPIFHGKRREQVITARVVAFDISSALVAESVGLLHHLFDSFENIIIPHSFMYYLFIEKQNLAFHQPSQVEKAIYFEDLVSNNHISIFQPMKTSSPKLALDVGDELAFILEEARSNLINDIQALVVCSYPVYKMEISCKQMEIDLSSFYDCLISCSQLVKRLKEMAVITEAQCDKALISLSQHGKEWPNAPKVAEGAKLFLDSLSITYLMSVDMLDKLSEAGFKVYVLRNVRDRYRMLINYNSIIKQSDEKIENIRQLFANGLSSGKVLLAEMPDNSERTTETNNNHVRQIEELFETMKLCDAVLIDDRFLNRHDSIELDKKIVPIFSSLDFVETLHYKGNITKEQKFDFRHSLRELGYEFIVVSYEELEHHINKSSVINGEFKPTKELKLLRENLYLIRISEFVQLPRNAQWLEETMNTIAKVIKAQWSADIPIEISRARSCWLYELMSYREWAQTHEIRNQVGLAYFGECLKVNSMLISLGAISGKRLQDYNAWLDEFVLASLKDNDTWSFKNMVDAIKQQLKNFSQQSESEEKLND